MERMNIYEFALIFVVVCFVLNTIFGKAKKPKKVKGKNGKEWYNNYLKSEHWQDTRKKALRNGHYRCAICGSKNHLQVHHLTYKNIYHEKDGDLKVLCKSCHSREHML